MNEAEIREAIERHRQEAEIEDREGFRRMNLPQKVKFKGLTYHPECEIILLHLELIDSRPEERFYWRRRDTERYELVGNPAPGDVVESALVLSDGTILYHKLSKSGERGIAYSDTGETATGQGYDTSGLWKYDPSTGSNTCVLTDKDMEASLGVESWPGTLISSHPHSASLVYAKVSVMEGSRTDRYCKTLFRLAEIDLQSKSIKLLSAFHGVAF